MRTASTAAAPAVSTTLPEVLDLLIVGAGPAGTAAALRARELGMAALVIDADDVLRRLRHYAPGLPVYPDVDGRADLPFPTGGNLVAHLAFEASDPDDLRARWHALYPTYNLPVRTGLELTMLERTDDRWRADVWNHRAHRSEECRARNVLLALGRGLPRRFERPGGPDALIREAVPSRLEDPARYVGAPACVLGDGPSAVEAVIVLSRAKADAGDPSPVYWSHRSPRLPHVPHALAERFAAAYAGHGNVRALPASDPVALLPGAPGEPARPFLSIRVERRTLPGAPAASTHYEFPASACLACIDEDPPDALLDALGLRCAPAEAGRPRRLVVTPLLESRLPGVYVAGDLLGPVYLEGETGDADPSACREVTRQQSIKAALRDGIYVVDVIQQRQEQGAAADAATSAADATLVSLDFLRATSAPPDDPRAAGVGGPALIRILPGGTEADPYPLPAAGPLTLGRQDADLTFPDDAALSAPHATLLPDGEGYQLRDEGSETGTFLRLPPGRPTPLSGGDLLRLGRQFLMFSREDGAWTLVHYDARGRAVGRHPLTEGTCVAGREAPDLTLDADDLLLSRRHVALAVREGTLQVKDLNSGNGTFLRVRRPVRVVHDDVFRIGRQIFRLALRAPAEPTAPPPLPPPPAAADGGAVPITLRDTGRVLRMRPSQTLTEAAEQAGVDLDAECHAGICGSDPVRIVSGTEHLAPPGDEETDTLEAICGLTAGNLPGQCRLACMLRAGGPVVLERLRP